MKMNKFENKTFFPMIALFILLSSLMVLPTVFAQTVLPGYTPMPDRITQTEVGLSPNFVACWTSNNR